MHLPALTDRIEERFVKPFAVNRMLALVPQSLEDARDHVQTSRTFEALESQIENYLNTTSGSGIDVAPWLRTLEKEVDRAAAHGEPGANRSEEMVSPITVAVSLRTMQRQLQLWGRETPKKRAES